MGIGTCLLDSTIFCQQLPVVSHAVSLVGGEKLQLRYCQNSEEALLTFYAGDLRMVLFLRCKWFLWAMLFLDSTDSEP